MPLKSLLTRTGHLLAAFCTASEVAQDLLIFVNGVDGQANGLIFAVMQRPAGRFRCVYGALGDLPRQKAGITLEHVSGCRYHRLEGVVHTTGFAGGFDS